MKINCLLCLFLFCVFASCKKDYTCNCRDASGFSWGSYSVVNKTKKKAKIACSEHDTDYTSVSATCTLE